MLIDFKVENYRSFKYEQDFSMETGARLRKYKENNTFELINQNKKINLLKSSMIFGANANGKTNLIYSIMMLRQLVVVPTKSDVQKLNFDSFAHKKGDTKFEITFLKKQKEYKYSIQYNPNEVVKEKLLVNNELIFDRDRQKFNTLPEQLNAIKDNIRRNQLMLFFAQQNNVEQASQAYRWFYDELILINTKSVPNVRFKMLMNHKFKSKFIKFMQAADFNIVDVDVKENSAPSPKFIAQRLGLINDSDDEGVSQTTKVYDVYFTHKSNENDFLLTFHEESEGTKIFVLLALNILSNQNKVLLIDEFDRAYHLELSKALINLINSKDQNNQFILTTHNLSLMDCKLRTDQIWFAEKNRYGQSKLFSLFDFDDPKLKRKDVKYKKQYLEGRYGATQIVDEGLLRKALNDSE
ncbi:AAA family ATPase [Nicoliella lavandulae]|uniref:ATP-binding protein n=1 Tax=Nicoliella lavandulae TaxID=3082954 RepID=A0ABU8SME9_9LACO